MVDWRAVGAGFLLVPAFAVLAAFVEPLLILAAGVPAGLLAGWLAGGVLRGLWHGVLVGLAATLLAGVVVALAAAALAPEQPDPVFGVGVALGLLFAVVLGVESVVGGLLGGAAGTFRPDRGTR